MNYRARIAGLDRQKKAYFSLEIANDESHDGIEYRISQVDGTWRRTKGILL